MTESPPRQPYPKSPVLLDLGGHRHPPMAASPHMRPVRHWSRSIVTAMSRGSTRALDHWLWPCLSSPRRTGDFSLLWSLTVFDVTGDSSSIPVSIFPHWLVGMRPISWIISPCGMADNETGVCLASRDLRVNVHPFLLLFSGFSPHSIKIVHVSF